MKTSARRFIRMALVLFAAAASQPGQAQTVIRGAVTDSNDEPLAGVNVYLAGTSVGTSTHGDGSYRFTTRITGSYDLIFSFVGFERKVIPLELLPDRPPLTHSVKLKAVPMELDEVEVVASNSEWKQNYARFVEQFIGTTSFADDTEIVNPYIIDFEESGRPGYLQASAPAPLEVENRALGYRLFIELDQYEWAKTGSSGYYMIYARFEEMEPRNNRERRQWNQNREKAYKGSPTHFFRSLYADRLRSNAFDYRETYNLEPLTDQETQFNLLGEEGVSKEMLGVMKGYRLLHGIRVEYGRINDYQTNRSGGDLFNIKTSDLLPTRADRTFFIDELGNLLNPRSIEIQGDMATQRVAYLLPLDYSPD